MEELRTAVRERGVGPDGMSAVQILTRHLEASSLSRLSGEVVRLNEFLLAASEASINMEKMKLTRIFQHLDTQGSGEVHISDIVRPLISSRSLHRRTSAALDHSRGNNHGTHRSAREFRT